MVLTRAPSSRQGVTPDDPPRSRPYRAGDRVLLTTRVTVPQRHLTLRCTVSPLRGARWWRAGGPRSKSMVVQSDVRSHLQRDPGRVPIHIDDRFGTGSRQPSLCREIQHPYQHPNLEPCLDVRRSRPSLQDWPPTSTIQAFGRPPTTIIPGGIGFGCGSRCDIRICGTCDVRSHLLRDPGRVPIHRDIRSHLRRGPRQWGHATADSPPTQRFRSTTTALPRDP